MQTIALLMMLPFAFFSTTSVHFFAWIMDIVFLPLELLEGINEKLEEIKNPTDE